MKCILSIEPEGYIKQTKAVFFLIVCVTENDLRQWNGNGSINMVEGNGVLDSKVFRKENLVNEYYKALRFFKNEAQQITEGRLEIVALPKLITQSGSENIE